MSTARSSVVPDLIDGLISAFTTALPDVTVTDGVAVGYAPGSYLMVGVDDPTLTQWVSASSTQEWPLATMTGRNEEATVTCAISTWSGDDDPKVARDAAFSIAGTVQSQLRDPSTLSTIQGLLWGSYARQTLTQWQTDDGSFCLLVFQAEFRARI